MELVWVPCSETMPVLRVAGRKELLLSLTVQQVFMSLERYVENAWLRREPTSPQEIAEVP